MKQIIPFLCCLLIGITLPNVARAYDFSAVSPSGHTLYYNILDGGHVAVVRPSSSDSYNNYVSGNLVIPASVQYNGSTYVVSELASFYDNGTYGTFYLCTQLTSVIIPNTVTVIDDAAFCACYNLNSVIIPNSVVTIGACSFQSCSSLLYVTIPNSVTTIDLAAFMQCSGLRLITIGNAVIEIGNNAFAQCTNLDTVVMLPPNPPMLGNNVFSNNSTGRKISVPCGSISAYQNANNWSNYSNDIQEPVVNLSINLISDNDTMGVVAITTPGIHNVRCDSTAVILATANYGYHFDHWSNGSIANPCTVFLTGDTIITAYFAKNVYTISGISNNNAMGNVSGSMTTQYLEHVTLSATANYGYHFSHWNDGNTTNPRNVQAIQNIVYTAYFDYNQYSIILHTANTTYGVCMGEGVYNYLSTQLISAIPNDGYHFTHWSDGDTNNPRSITLMHDTTFTAFFAKNIYEVNACSYDSIQGSVSGGGLVEHFDTITLTATANYGYHFSHWNDGCTDNPRQLIVTSSQSYIAFFNNNQYNIIVSVDTSIHGSCSGGGNYNYLSQCVVAATANYGYQFTMWNDGDTNNPRVVCLTQDTSFTALFANNQYTLTVQSNDETQGSVSNGGVFDYLDTATIVATASEHYHFMRWDDGNTDNPREYVIVGDAILTAIFAIDTHTVTVTANDIARGMAEATGTEFSYGTPCTVTATAYTGYVFSRWSNGITANPYTFAVLEDTELIAIFEEEGTQGIDDVFDINGFVVYCKGRSIYICGIEGQPLSVYGIDGRIIVTKHRATEQETIHAPSTGVYFIKVGDLPAQKVVVMR